MQHRDGRIVMLGFVKVYDETGRYLSDATVRELSGNNVYLRLRRSQILPQRLVVTWPDRQVSKLGTVNWINGASIGIEFEKDAENVNIPSSAK